MLTSLAELEKEALALNETERARLAAKLLDTLSADIEISDEEVLKRDTELETGQANEISHGEFVRRVKRERGE